MRTDEQRRISTACGAYIGDLPSNTLCRLAIDSAPSLATSSPPTTVITLKRGRWHLADACWCLLVLGWWLARPLYQMGLVLMVLILS